MNAPNLAKAVVVAVDAAVPLLAVNLASTAAKLATSPVNAPSPDLKVSVLAVLLPAVPPVLASTAANPATCLASALNPARNATPVLVVIAPASTAANLAT